MAQGHRRVGTAHFWVRCRFGTLFARTSGAASRMACTWVRRGRVKVRGRGIDLGAPWLHTICSRDPPPGALPQTYPSRSKREESGKEYRRGVQGGVQKRSVLCRHATGLPKEQPRPDLSPYSSQDIHGLPLPWTLPCVNSCAPLHAPPCHPPCALASPPPVFFPVPLYSSYLALAAMGACFSWVLR